MEDITGRKLSQPQIDELQNALKNNDYSKTTGESLSSARNEFKRKKNAIIKEWEGVTGQKWPTYVEDIYSADGRLLRSAGQSYDAHHIIELSLGGDNAGWNIHPAMFPDEH